MKKTIRIPKRSSEETRTYLRHTEEARQRLKRSYSRVLRLDLKMEILADRSPEVRRFLAYRELYKREHEKADAYAKMLGLSLAGNDNDDLISDLIRKKEIDEKTARALATLRELVTGGADFDHLSEAIIDEVTSAIDAAMGK